jgi:hypothetical protein
MMSVKSGINAAIMAASVCAALSCDFAVQAATVAYWRFETGPANTDVIHTIGDGQFDGTTPDVSGNGNHLSAWSQGGCCGYQYRADVPFSPVPQTGAANNFSVRNTAADQACLPPHPSACRQE